MRQADTAGFMTLQQIVNRVKLDINDFTDRDYKRLVVWAKEGMDELSLRYIHKVKTLKQYVNKDLNTVPFPEDCMGILGVGEIRNGEFFGYSYEPNLTTKIEDIEEELRPSSYDDSEDIISYGVNDTYYNVDINGFRIILTGRIQDFVFIKYKSSGVGAPDNTFIPNFAKETLVAFIKHRLVADDRDIPEYIINRKLRDYEKARRRMMAYQTHTIEQIYDSLAKTWTPLPQ